jgi:hypothetical protein
LQFAELRLQAAVMFAGEKRSRITNPETRWQFKE